MKAATNKKWCAILALGTLALGAQFASAVQDDKPPEPKVTQKWVSTTYTFDGDKVIVTVTCAPTGKNCPLPDPPTPG
jgi:hypothetical protein